MRSHRYLLKVLLVAGLLFLYQSASSQISDSLFIRSEGTNLAVGMRQFYAIGVNSYFLQNLAAYGDTAHLLEVLQSAKALGINTIRTWGFFDSDDSTNRAVIQYGAGKYNERGLRALDYVIAKASEFSFRLIIPLVNNWDDYGGMNQYVEWFAERKLQSATISTSIQQRIIYGVEGRSFRVQVSGSFTHDDFYRNDTIKQWYKNYLQMILERTNTITGIKYMDEPAIAVWELANEPRSLDGSGELVKNWLHEMSSFVKFLDARHLLSSGEEGFDVTSNNYSNISKYNQQTWLFDGSNGVSFKKNILLPNIDVASIHCYPSAWKLTYQSAIVWLKDHKRIASESNKPMIFGEVGIKGQAKLFYQAIFNETFYQNTSGILLWQFVYQGRRNNDGYAFSCPSNEHVCSVLSDYAYKFHQKSEGIVTNPTTTQLLQNYPNPFNSLTMISYDLPIRSFVRMEVYNGIGQLVDRIAEEEQEAGFHQTLFDAANHANGVYFVRLLTNSNNFNKKIVLVK
ncbi:MAG: T9SS type A sorting domain-containing protein [Ignavibacteriales bacterium]|nr:T9SS type A sorting domain-containing protein [Ignavibacteriales bacterium]